MTHSLRVGVFAAVFVLFYGGIQLADSFERWFIEGLTVPVAVWLINHSGALEQTATAAGSRILASGGGINVLQGCEGLDVLGLWVAAIAAGPFSARGRLLGWTVGVAAVFALNQLRLVSLFGVYRGQRDLFAEAHGLWSPLGIVACVLVLFVLWQRWFASSVRVAAPAPPTGGAAP